MTLPWDDPFNVPDQAPAVPVKILWDYSTGQVIDGGEVSCGLFDTHWTYTYYPWRTSLQWALTRCPGECLYKQEAEVPEMVRLAVMIAV
jgi:hypothetical protein